MSSITYRIAVQTHEGQKLERLCRYIARPAGREKRLSLSPQGSARPAVGKRWEIAENGAGEHPSTRRSALR